MRLLCRYAGGLACLVTALALVACGGGPGSQPEPKQIGNSTLEVGKSLEIALGDKFNGSDLTFSAATSNVRVATVTVDDNDTLTVTAVGAGTATITVTAKNSRGEAKQTFTVTVPKPPAPDPEPVEIPNIPSLERDGTRRIPLGDKFSGENLTYGATSSHDHVATVRVDNDADTLTVTAVGPGTATITVTATAAAQGSATQTKRFTVTVPPPEVTAPTVKPGARTSIDVVIGTPATVSLSTVFDGATSYSASSSAGTIATTSESGGILTITGAGAGTATITVTGRNSAGSREHPITANVTAATPPPETTPTPQEDCSLSGSSLTITVRIIRDNSKNCTLPNDHSLIYDGTEVTVSHREGNTWTITAVTKGRHVVHIVKDDGTRPGEITVIVPNTPPALDEDLTVGEVDCDPQITNATLIASEDAADAPTPVLATRNINPVACFEDADDGDDEFRFKVFQKPDEVLLRTDRGFVAFKHDDDPDFTIKPQGLDPLTTEAIILRAPNQRPDGSVGGPYQISLSAYDSDGAQSNRPATFTFNSELPKTRMYNLTKSGTSYKTKVGNRIGVVHTINLTNTGEGQDGIVNYNFLDFALPSTIQNFIETRNREYDGTVSETTSDRCDNLERGRPTDPALQTPDTVVGTGCWFSSIFGTEANFGTEYAGGATIEFQLGKDRRLNDAGDVRITIDYYVVVKAAEAEVTDGGRVVTPAKQALIPKMGSRSLTLDIHSCTTTDDCP